MGVRSVNQIVENCARRGVEVLTLFAFSSENWNRPKEEVSMLMSRFLQALDDEVEDLHKNVASLGFDLADLEARKLLSIDHIKIDPTNIIESGDYEMVSKGERGE